MEEETQTVFIASDASVSTDSGIAAWACYIRTPHQTFTKGGIIKPTVRGSTDAERFALANALFIADRISDLEKLNLIIYCDNKYAYTEPINKLSPASKNYEYRQRNVQIFKEHIEAYLKKAKSYELEHVKGHSAKRKWRVPNTKYNMNHWCDKKARELLRREVGMVKKVTEEMSA